MRITCAITHIPLLKANDAKLALLDHLACEFMSLTQQYATLFCTTLEPDAYHDLLLESTLSQRWQRVAVQQAAGIAQSWRSNRQKDFEDYLETCEAYDQDELTELPIWREPHLPTLKNISIQANTNVALLQKSSDSSFDYWLRLSTLDKRKPLWLPINLALYHRQALTGKKVNKSVLLQRHEDGWWLILTYTEHVKVKSPKDAAIVGVDVGIASFITASDGKHYGSFHGQLVRKHQLDREKRRRKAKLRAALKKKGVEKLPSTRNLKLARHVKQEINRSVNLFFADHEGQQIALEKLSVATMRFKTRRMNAYLYAAQLAHLPKQLEWGAQKRGVRITWVKSAYSSQECSQCHHVSRANRPTQQTFCCEVCGHRAQADENAAVNIAARLGDKGLQQCASRAEIKLLLDHRHERWQQEKRLVVVQPPAQFTR